MSASSSSNLADSTAACAASSIALTASSAGEEMELTILMPCLNESLTLVKCIEWARDFFERSGVRGEVLIADNGSTDGSPELARKAGARVVHVSRRGYGAALIEGIRQARGRYVVMGDSDQSYDFSRLDAFVERLRQGDDLVMGNRFRGGISPGAMPALHKYLGNPVLSFLGRLFFNSDIGDFHCGLRGFNRNRMASLGLRCEGMEFASEMIVKATLAQFKISEVPTTLWPDGRDRPPHLRSWRDGWRHLRFLLLHSPFWLYLVPGRVFLFSGLLAMCILAAGPVAVGSVTFDIHSLLYSMLAFNFGAQLVLFAGLSSLHEVRLGVLPSVPKGMGWIHSVTLERLLVFALFCLLSGLGMAAMTFEHWLQVGLGPVDPSSLMRLAIPAAALVLLSGQLLASAFLLEFVRMDPVVHAALPGNGAGSTDLLSTQVDCSVSPSGSIASSDSSQTIQPAPSLRVGKRS